MHPSQNQKKLEQQHEQSIMLAEGGIELVIGNNDASNAIDCRERSVEAGRQAVQGRGRDVRPTETESFMLCGWTRLALQDKQRVALVLLRPCSGVLDVAKVRRHHDFKFLGGDAKIGKVLLRAHQYDAARGTAHHDTKNLRFNVSDARARELLQHEKRSAILLGRVLRKSVHASDKG